MKRKTNLSRLAFRGGLILALGAALSACGGGNKSSTAVVTTPTTPAATCDTFLEQFGLGFCQKYKTAANTDPTDVATNDIVPIDATKDPIAVP